MKICYISKQIDEHLAREAKAEAKAEWAANVIAERKEELMAIFSVMTKLEIDIYLSTNYSFDLAEHVSENMGDDGVAEYYIQGQNQYFKAAMASVFECLDFTGDIEREITRLEEL